ncbi:MAG: type III pantothenate kinase [Pseudomonadota bacterium]
MRLLIDAGNTRVKWQLRERQALVRQGADEFNENLFAELANLGASVNHVAISTVISEARRIELVRVLGRFVCVTPRFFWSEANRGGLVSAYEDPAMMGADRWHAMYGAWQKVSGAFAVVDAGSAITVDYVNAQGAHLGGYILPGRGMMLRSLKNDAARIGFGDHDAHAGEPGGSTTECVHHGLFWLWQSMVSRIQQDCRVNGISSILLTGGDAAGIKAAGLRADHVEDLVLAGLAAIDAEECASL